jgi:hypothetical protein
MKRVFWLLVLVGAVLLSVTPAQADDGFYVVGARVTMGTRITSLPCEIKNSGYYYLTGNLSYAGGNGITVTTDNVTIDLMGFAPYGPSNSSSTASGIYLNGRNNVEVRNGTLGGWYYGVFENSSSGAEHRVINLRAQGNRSGILLNGNRHLIKGCTALPGGFGSGDGLDIFGTGTVSGCTVFNFSSGTGILIGDGTVSGNVVFSCATGINASGRGVTSYNQVSACGTGIYGSGGGSIIGNAVSANSGQTGIVPSTSTSTPNVLDQNTVGGSGTHYGPGSSATVWGLNGN